MVESVVMDGEGVVSCEDPRNFYVAFFSAVRRLEALSTMEMSLRTIFRFLWTDQTILGRLYSFKIH
jgi:hypothetical protein